MGEGHLYMDVRTFIIVKALKQPRCSNKDGKQQPAPPERSSGSPSAGRDPQQMGKH